MRILVTGAAGMLGVDLLAHLAGRHETVGIDLEVDITDPRAIGERVRAERPEAIIHCAAWTDVDRAEEREADAYAVNADGSANVAAAAAAAGAALVCVSTDYVFSGTSESPYFEDDEPSPLGAYGRTKLAGERAARAGHPRGTRVVRTSWLYGAYGRNFVDTMLRLGEEGDEVRVVADQVGSPTWSRDLAPALETAIGLPPGIYHATGGGETSWAGFAEAIFAEAGIACAVRPVTTAESGRPAPRPAHSVLGVSRPGAPRLRDWHLALRDYLKETRPA